MYFILFIIIIGERGLNVFCLLYFQVGCLQKEVFGWPSNVPS
jgi:hypothetical protein